ncbi:hypothetical protein BJ964_005915 [Actinoplanes lobatus]|uniref:Uncharacterized protein n=1 Tax=Actinoplanes lobatus TaxID=113568 RepID=A0A7W7HJN3_9ACTN|nr:hypothetical protein [Actinoplanes lobatus]
MATRLVQINMKAHDGAGGRAVAAIGEWRSATVLP